MPNFYFGSMPVSGTANVFIEMFANRNFKKNFVKPCPLEIFNFNGTEYSIVGKPVNYVKEIEDKFQVGFRSVDWKNEIKYLETYLEKNQHLNNWFATFDDEIFYFIKNYFRDNVLTIAINYSENDFQFVFDKWVNYQSGLILNRSKYSNIKNQFQSFNDVRLFCQNNGPEYFGLHIPKSKKTIGDYNINIVDIFNKSKLETILNELDSSCQSLDWNFYSKIINLS